MEKNIKSKTNTNTKATKPKAVKARKEVSLLDKYVFMNKTLQVLEVGLKTEKNVILYGPGGHGKSDLSLEFLYAQGINPYVFTMGTGTTTDRLFGGMDIQEFERSGKIHYLCDNSFMNHEHVIFEEMMDGPDYILEQLKDIISSGFFRNGTQVYPIKTRFIICCTNRTREEFSKNDSLRALMERFPLEHNVIWDNYTDASYTTLLESRFGKGKVDPIIPFMLAEYHKNKITMSPRIALDCYSIFEECGPENLIFIAEIAKKPEILQQSLKKFESTIAFKKLASELMDTAEELSSFDIIFGNKELEDAYITGYKGFELLYTKVNRLVVNDDLAQEKASLDRQASDLYSKFNKIYTDIFMDRNRKVKEANSPVPTASNTPAGKAAVSAARKYQSKKAIVATEIEELASPVSGNYTKGVDNSSGVPIKRIYKTRRAVK